MALSKSVDIVYELVGAYFHSLYSTPLKTKALTSCCIATLGSYVSQKLSRAKHLNHDSLIAFALFGFIFGGPVPHYFYQHIHKLTKHSLGILLIERILYTPCFQVLSLYMLARFEGKTHETSYAQLEKLYWPVLAANWKYLTLFQFINITFVPPMLRVLVVNLIGFFWSIYLANKRAKQTAMDRARKE
ncbi:PXMP2/4 family protein 3 [Neodiprion pinetum]|uniref:PXMP2/4 family protein 3 n=1 Tax=Neodiprion pinetum TaxID=441929 RepID=UPI001EE0CBB5|nr:PXMP2/4 family protein 3 [Neodiprion pinetum]